MRYIGVTMVLGLVLSLVAAWERGPAWFKVIIGLSAMVLTTFALLEKSDA